MARIVLFHIPIFRNELQLCIDASSEERKKERVNDKFNRLTGNDDEIMNAQNMIRHFSHSHSINRLINISISSVILNIESTHSSSSNSITVANSAHIKIQFNFEF